MSSFLFLRHGLTDWNVEGRMQGSTDIPLNETGREQARRAAQILKEIKVDRVITSQQQRAHETARIITDALRKPLEVDPRLRERGFGLMEGKTRADLEAGPKERFLIPNSLQSDGRPLPIGAETTDETWQRAWGCITQALEIYKNEVLLFVSHGAIFREVAFQLTGELLVTDNAIPYRFSRQDARWQITHALDSLNEALQPKRWSP